MNRTSTTSTMTAGQRKSFNRLVEDITAHCKALVLAKVDADTDGWQLLLENGGELKTATAETFVAKAHELLVSNQFADEEVLSSYDYPTEYKGPKPIVEQINKLAEIFGLDPSQALTFTKTLGKHPDGTDGWFALPTVDAIAAKFFPEVEDPTERHCRAINLVFEKLAATRRFENYRHGEITPNRLRQHARTAAALKQISKQQPGDIVIVAAQFGRKFRGKSVRRVQVLFKKNEFGFGALQVGCMALTHPERFVRYEQLHTDCPGDEFSKDADGRFDEAPVFVWSSGGLNFWTVWFNLAGDRIGSVSGLLPQTV